MMRQYTGDHLAAQLIGGVTYIAGELAEVQIALLRVLHAHPVDCGHAIYSAHGDHLDAICAADSAWGDNSATREARVQHAMERLDYSGADAGSLTRKIALSLDWTA